jgi:hypothetical protein
MNNLYFVNMEAIFTRDNSYNLGVLSMDVCTYHPLEYPIEWRRIPDFQKMLVIIKQLIWHP